MVSMLSLLKENPDSRKIFGERELKIIEKQLNGLVLTQSEKNRLSRDIRKKLNFIKEISKFKDEFKLEKAAIIKKLIKESKDVILEDVFFENIKEIWVFGSFVENKMTFRSDVDIAVLFKKELSKREEFEFRTRVLGRLPEKIDVQVFDSLLEKIKKSIQKKHQVIYKNE